MPDELETQDVATPDEQAVEPVLDALADEAVSTGADEAEATAPLVPAPTKREYTEEEYRRAVQAETDRREARRLADANKKRLLDAARTDDLLTLGEALKEQLRPDLEAEAAAPVAATVYARLQASLDAKARELPQAVVTKLAAMDYTGLSFEEAATKWLSNAADVLAEHKYQERAPARKKAALAATVGAEPRPNRDVGGSAANNGERYTNWTAVSQALADGKVSLDYVRNYRNKYGENY